MANPKSFSAESLREALAGLDERLSSLWGHL